MINKKNNICLITLGCPKNVVEGENILGLLKEKGYGITVDIKKADSVLVHTCSFIEDAKKESLETINDLSKLKQKGLIKKIIVSGCLVQKEKEKIASMFPFADSFVGTGELHKIAGVVAGGSCYRVGKPGGLLETKSERVLSSNLPTAYLKLAEGCNHRCSFCVIPQLKGRYISRKQESILVEAKELVDKGIRELVLVAQDTSVYGLDIYGKYALPGLIEKLSGIDRVKWIRIMYAYPSTVTKELADVIKNNQKVCKYIDIPLQHISKNVLRKMARPVNSKAVVEMLKDRVPGIAIRTTLITGFPGENKEDHDKLKAFVSSGVIEHLGVFEYSDDNDARSSQLKNRVSKTVALKRKNELMKLQQKSVVINNARKIGKCCDVLVEGKTDKGYSIARSEFQAPEIDSCVLVKGDLKVGSFEKVKITGFKGYDLIGELVV